MFAKGWPNKGLCFKPESRNTWRRTSLQHTRGSIPPFLFLAFIASLVYAGPTVRAQTTPAPEITTQEVPPTFKVQVQRNVVVVRVVIRDAKGRPVPGLKKEDFRLFDNRKEQAITQFVAESPLPQPDKGAKPTPREPEPEPTPENVLAAAAPRNYQALYFDDVEMKTEDIIRTRDAASRYLASTHHAGDRVAIITSSGQVIVDFTDDPAKLHEALFRLRERPVTIPEINACPQIDDYQAYLIVHRRDPYAISIATEEGFHCYCEQFADQTAQENCRSQAASRAEQEAMHALSVSETQSGAALRELELLVRRMAALPGRRSIIFISPGFMSYTQQGRIGDIVDRALRSNVIINTFDSKGLATILPYGDASQSPVLIPRFPGLMARKQLFAIDSFSHAVEVLRNFATDTGGEFFHNSNDLDGGFRQLGTPEDVYYVLTFSPQNLKLDGRFHNLRVSLLHPAGLTVQARRGYFAPKSSPDAAAQAKEEIEQALFSQDEMHELPIEVHTQFFKVDEANAKLFVLTHLDLHLLPFRKDQGRNLNNLRFVTALFDRDGKLVSGKEKILELRLLDASLERLAPSGITLKTSFDIRPGAYLVREVVREAENGQISGLNRTVEIPY